MKPGAGDTSHPGRASVFWTLFGLEALFNPVGHQRSGLLRAVRAGLPRRMAASRVLEELAGGPCSTNPVLSGYIAGLLIREAAADGDDETRGVRDAVERCRSLLAPLVAAAGDRLFWGFVRPALSAASLLSALFGTFEPALLYCLGYNATQIWWRRRALAAGLQGEQTVRRELREGRLERASAAWGSAGRVVLGALAGVLLVEGWDRLGPAGSVLPLLTGLAGWRLAGGRGYSPMASAAIGLAVAIAVSAALAAGLGGGSE